METVKSFVTGAGGFMGSYLVDFLTEQGHEVSGIYFGPVNLTGEIKNKCGLIECDIRHKNKLEEILSKIKPNFIYHLAAQSYPTVSWEQPQHTVEVNTIGTINLFESVKKLKFDCRILNAGSSAEYGNVLPNDIPVKEGHRLRPLHPYGCTKVDQENLAYQYYKNFRIDSFTMRIFNTTGPRKEMDVCSDFTKQLAAIELKKQNPVIRVGNLGTKRAITDVRDVIRGFYMAIDKAAPGDAYNISGSRAYFIKEILDAVLFYCKANIKVEEDEKLMRTTDEKVIFGDSTKFRRLTGWQQEIPLHRTIDDMIKYWIGKLQKT